MGTTFLLMQFLTEKICHTKICKIDNNWRSGAKHFV